MFPKDDMLKALYMALAVFGATLASGLAGLPLIRRQGSGQPIRDNGPQTHLVKAGTPTFGGLFFMVPILLLGAVTPFLDKDYLPLGIMVLFMGLFGAVGFGDDFIKVRISKKGMSVKQKTVLLGLFSLLAVICYLWLSPAEPFILIPLTAEPVTVTGGWKILYLLILVPFLFYMGNSVNITDGLDGLLSSLMAVASLGLFAAFGIIFPRISPYGPSVLALSAALLGGVLAFIFFNRHPARIFMGDTGSQALGAGFTLLTILAGVPYLALITGFVFFFEGLSVVIQVIYFKSTGGKRIFRMSPIHHHFELVGWHETKVVRIFNLVAILWAGLGILLVSGPLFGS